MNLMKNLKNNKNSNNKLKILLYKTPSMKAGWF